jgi:hypothetical protein
MHWLADNYKWLFDGIGALVIIGVVGYLLRRFRHAAEPASHLVQPSQEKTDSRAELRVEDSQVQPEKFNPNIRIIESHQGSTFVKQQVVQQVMIQPR